jgi:glutaminyl-tRNA synthetase
VSSTPKDAPAGKPEDHAPNFVDELVQAELDAGRTRLVTRFPPEPNGYLHIGHAKAIVTNFSLAKKLPTAHCNLRFDDTNPVKEETEFVESIQEDIRWLGFDWGEHGYFASDYFQQLYEMAVRLIKDGKAYVDSQSLEAIREGRGNFHNPGTDSPFRGRSVDQNLDLFARMRAGEFDEGAHVLRAKIDMGSKDLKLRDPVMYRILKVEHHRTGSAWSIYPMYDWAHGQSDAIEGVTHSICTLEFQNHRGLYEWFHEQLGFEDPPKQIEFARLNLTYTVLSKRSLQKLVEAGHVSGWDDPRMPTVAGLRRRGVSPASIRAFCERVGVSKRDSFVDVTLFEHAIREDLNASSPRLMGVLRPLRVVIENYPEDAEEVFELPLNPGDDAAGSRSVPFCREVYVDREDFMEVPAPKFWRIFPGNEVRLRGAGLITVNTVIKDDAGEVTELRATWDPESRGGNAPDGRKIKGTVHWVSARHAVDAEVRLYDRLFTEENPLGHEDTDFMEFLNPGSLEVLSGCKVEAAVRDFGPLSRLQLERTGYFCVDAVGEGGDGGGLVLNRTIALKDSWAKVAARR